MTDHEDRQLESLTIDEANELGQVPLALGRYWRKPGTRPRDAGHGRCVLYRREGIDAWVTHQRERNAPDQPA